jgi:polysaccharide chain length determinant protein (PEP-CTERM system associated)
MDPVRIMLLQYLLAAWRRRWSGILMAWLVCGLGWVGTYAIPNQFESNARLFVDTDAILTPLLRGIAPEQAPATQLEVLQRTLLSKPNLEKLISKTDLDLTIGGPLDRERLITRLGTDIKVTPQTKNLFTISYRDKNPRLARDVVQTLLTIFVENATGSNRTDMENARRFLERQIQSFQQQLHAAEQRRAEFRVRYMEILPNDLNPNVGALETARTQVTQLSGRLQDAIIQRDSLRKEVQNAPVMLVAEAGAVASTGLPPTTKLADAVDALRTLALRDTGLHPDVIAQMKLVESLRTAGGRSNGSKAASGSEMANGDAASLTRSVPNPVYDQLKVRLIEAETQVISLTRQRDEANATQDRLEKISREQPGLFAEYQNMDRDYNVLRKNYEDLLGRLQSANIAQAADTQADKVKLQVIDPPEVAKIPATPNRPLLVTGVLLGGVTVGFGMTILFGQFDQSFSSIDDLRALGVPVLGGISMLGLAPFRQRLIAALRFSGAVAVLMGVYGGLIVHVLRSAALI